MTLTLAVVNDYPLVVAGLQAALEPFSDRVHVAAAVVDDVGPGDGDVVLLDTFGNPDTPAPDPRTRIGLPGAKLVIFSWDSSEPQVRAALANGADGYLSKTLPPEDLVDGLERVHRGERVVVEAAARADETPVQGRWPGDEHALTAREAEILALIGRGLSNVEISQQAYIGVNTVKTHIRSAYRKIGVTTRSQAVIWTFPTGSEHPDHVRDSVDHPREA